MLSVSVCPHLLRKVTLVALLSPEVTEDLVSVRLLIETEAAGLAARRHVVGRIAEVRELHDKMRREIESGRLAAGFEGR